jgi:nucleoside-diphosphate-sugar epimerase
LTGYAIAPERSEPRIGDIRHSALDAGRAKRELGWAAATPLDQGLRLTLESRG